MAKSNTGAVIYKVKHTLHTLKIILSGVFQGLFYVVGIPALLLIIFFPGVRTRDQETAYLNEIKYNYSFPDEVQGVVNDNYDYGLFGQVHNVKNLSITKSVKQRFYWQSNNNQEMLPLYGISRKDSSGLDRLTTLFVSLEGDGAVLISHGQITSGYDVFCGTFWESHYLPESRYIEIRLNSKNSEAVIFSEGKIPVYPHDLNDRICKNYSYKDIHYFKESFAQWLVRYNMYLLTKLGILTK